MVVNTEGQLLLCQALIDSVQYASSRIAGDIAAPQQLRKAHRVFNILIVFKRRGIVRNTTNTRTIELLSCGAEQLILWMIHQHKLATRHLYLANVQRVQLGNHAIYREAVVAIGAHPYMEPTE